MRMEEKSLRCQQCGEEIGPAVRDFAYMQVFGRSLRVVANGHKELASGVFAVHDLCARDFAEIVAAGLVGQTRRRA